MVKGNGDAERSPCILPLPRFLDHAPAQIKSSLGRAHARSLTIPSSAARAAAGRGGRAGSYLMSPSIGADAPGPATFTPGFRIPFGSKARLVAAKSSIVVAG